jgi:hypothetical protein
MKTNHLSAICIAFSFLLLSCATEKPKEDVSSKEDSMPGRNLFGHNIPRGLTKTSEGLAPGYIMFCPSNSPYVYLINRKGEVVHEWKGNYGVMQSYLMDDGSIVLGADDPDYPVFGFGGPYGRIQKVTWDGKMLWDFEYATEEYIVHHDFAVLSNGNILAIAYEVMPFEEAVANGRKPELTPKSGPWMEKIIEIEPEGKSGGKIVWEWYVKDHLIQDFDESKANYGSPVDHPELLDINRGSRLPPAITQDSLDVLRAAGKAERNRTTHNLGSDIFHFNALNYNSGLDQIAISSPHLNEILIIDHSTTTEEAAGHIGGKSGKGGDLLYRWGNPQNYQMGDSTDRKLFGQHDVRWIEKGKPGQGNLTVFNNHPPGDIDWSNMGAVGNNYSAIYELKPPLEKSGSYVIEENKPFGPELPVWSYIASDTLSFYSSFISGSHRMQNGNTFINEGASGRFIEVTPDGQIIWEYLNPYRGEIRKPNGDPVNAMFMTYSNFRSTFIPANHVAFEGKDLKPLDSQPTQFKLPPKTEKKKSD